MAEQQLLVVWRPVTGCYTLDGSYRQARSGEIDWVGVG
jgi:hypothetical protein